MEGNESELVVGVVTWEPNIGEAASCSKDPYTCTADCSLDDYCPREGNHDGCSQFMINSLSVIDNHKG